MSKLERTEEQQDKQPPSPARTEASVPLLVDAVEHPQPNHSDLTLKSAAKQLLAFWPFLLRMGANAGGVAAMSYIIAKEDIEFLGAYAAYQSVIGLAIGMLYASIFPLVTFMSAARKKEKDALNAFGLLNTTDAPFRDRLTALNREALTVLHKDAVSVLGKKQFEGDLPVLKPLKEVFEAFEKVHKAVSAKLAEVSVDDLPEKELRMLDADAERVSFALSQLDVDATLPALGRLSEEDLKEEDLDALKALKALDRSALVSLKALNKDEIQSLMLLKLFNGVDLLGPTDWKVAGEEKIDKARKKAQTVFRQGVIFCTLLTIPSTIFSLTASGLFKLFQMPEIVQKHAHDYLALSAPGFAVDIFYRLTARTVTGLGVRKSILIGDIFDNMIELLMAYAFLGGKLGAPKWSIEGVAIAYSISKAITLLLHTAYIYMSPRIFGFDYTPYKFFQLSRPFFDKETFKKLISAGIPDGLSSIASAIASMLVVMFCGQFGTAPLVGIQVASVFSSFANMHGSAILNFACNKIGESADNKRSNNVPAYGRMLIGLYFMISMIACTVANLFPREIAAGLIDKNNSAHQPHLATATTFLRIQGVFELMNGIYVPTMCTLDALLDNTFLLIMTIVFELGLNPGAAAAMRFGFKKDADYVFAASGIGILAASALMLWRCYQIFQAYGRDPGPVAAAQPEGRVIEVPDEDRPPLGRAEAEVAAPVQVAMDAKKSTGMLASLKQMIWHKSEEKRGERAPLLQEPAMAA